MKYRKLQPNHRTRLPGAIVTVDTESWEQVSEANPNVRIYPLRLGVARYCRLEGGLPTRRKELRFKEATEFWEWVYGLMDDKRVLWLWAHNLGWDLTVLRFWREMEEGRMTLQGPSRNWYDPATGETTTRPTPGLLVTKDPPTCFCVWDSRQFKLKGCDTYNWYPKSLKVIGEMMGLPKLEFPGCDGDESALWTYCERDCLITEKAVLDILGILRTNDLGNMRYTPASQSMSVFRHVTSDLDVRLHGDADLTEFERRSYYGGRRHVFFRGEVRRSDHFALESDAGPGEVHPVIYTGPVYALDLIAAYPAVMRHNLYPNFFTRMLREINPSRAIEILRYEGACAWVLIESYDEPWPIRRPEGVAWMTGQFQTGLCGPELVRAISAGYVQWIHQIAFYNVSNIFQEFVDRLIDIERTYSREVEPVRRGLIKTMRNSLHGKFGQRGKSWETMPGQVEAEPWGTFTAAVRGGKGYEWRRRIGHTVQREIDDPVTKDTFAAISAYTTAYSRELMRSLIGQAGSNNVYYLDSDTIHVSAAGYESLVRQGHICSETPGKLRVVGVADTVRYFAPKHYCWDGAVVNCGLPHNAVPLPDGRHRVDKFKRMESIVSSYPPSGGVVTTEEIDAPHHQLGARDMPDGWTRPLIYVP